MYWMEVDVGSDFMLHFLYWWGVGFSLKNTLTGPGPLDVHRVSVLKSTRHHSAMNFVAVATWFTEPFVQFRAASIFIRKGLY
jgi:hypothetical protein